MLESSDLPEGQQEILTVVLTGVVINGGFVNKVPVLRSSKRAPANVRRLNNRNIRQRYCSVGERSRALALLNAAMVRREDRGKPPPFLV